MRLVADEPKRAWVLATSLDELKGHEEPINERRPAGSAYSRNFGGDNWSDIRAKDMAYADRDPAVLIVGAGQAGLAIAARLRLLGVDTLLVDSARAGRGHLAGALSLAGAAQPGQPQPHALSAVAAELAEVPAEGHDRRLARDLRLGDGMQRLERDGIPSAPPSTRRRAPGTRELRLADGSERV